MLNRLNMIQMETNNIENANKLHITFFGFPAHGHTNPTLPFVSALINQGHKVTYFNTLSFKESIEKSFQESIAKTNFKFIDYEILTTKLVELFEDYASMNNNKNRLMRLHKILFEITLDLCQNLGKKPDALMSDFDAIIYDSLAFWGQAFAEQNKIPSFCLCTTFLFDKEDILELMPGFEEAIDIDKEYSNKLEEIKKYYNNLNSYHDVLNIQVGVTADAVINFSSAEF